MNALSRLYETYTKMLRNQSNYLMFMTGFESAIYVCYERVENRVDVATILRSVFMIYHDFAVSTVSSHDALIQMSNILRVE